jgi:invasion protein IalB
MFGGEVDHTRQGTRLRALTLLATDRSPVGLARGVPHASDDGARTRVRWSNPARNAAQAEVVFRHEMVAALRSA